MRAKDVMVGIGFMSMLIGIGGLAGLVETGTGHLSIALLLIIIGGLLLGADSITEEIRDAKKNNRIGFDASYPCFLDFKRKGRR